MKKNKILLLNLPIAGNAILPNTSDRQKLRPTMISYPRSITTELTESYNPFPRDNKIYNPLTIITDARLANNRAELTEYSNLLQSAIKTARTSLINLRDELRDSISSRRTTQKVITILESIARDLSKAIYREHADLIEYIMSNMPQTAKPTQSEEDIPSTPTSTDLMELQEDIKLLIIAIKK